MSSSKDLLFAPPNGKEYHDDDWKILCRNTPVPLYDIPKYLLDKSRITNYDPPVLWCGWPVGEGKLLDLAERRYPNIVKYDLEGKIINSTLIRMEKSIRREFQIPEEMEDCLLVTDFRFADGHIDCGLVVGNNHMGIIPPITDIIDRIADTLFEGEEPGWYLDPQHWRWTPKPRPRRTRPKLETPSIVGATAA